MAQALAGGAEVVEQSTATLSAETACMTDQSARIIDAVIANAAEAVSASAARGAARINAITDQVAAAAARSASAGALSAETALRGLVAGLVTIVDCTTLEADQVINVATLQVENAINTAARLSVLVASAETNDAKWASAAATAASKHIARSLVAGVSALTHGA